MDPSHDQIFLLRRCEQSSATLWRTTENGVVRKACRDARENSNARLAGPAKGSGFVAVDEPATAKIFSAETCASGLCGPYAKCPLEPFRVVRPDLGVDDARRPLAVERVENLLGRDPAHVLARLLGDPCGMRARQHVVELQQRVLRRRRLLVPDVEAGAGDPLVAQRVIQRLLVVNEA